ncbi:hypothetical protein M885DRAFT_540455 [Pelagophyceae sp. CCMP2097]|nr:hypothetical protein M885DRAFT_540455 [Pelagophyceae sp. CCMP2097]
MLRGASALGHVAVVAAGAACAGRRSWTRCEGPSPRLEGSSPRLEGPPLRLDAPPAVLARLHTDGYAILAFSDDAGGFARDFEAKMAKAIEASPGRFHYVVRWKKEDKELRQRLEEYAAPMRAFAQTYFQEGEKFGISELQLLDAVPGAASQIWHVDNARRGLTFVVPVSTAVRSEDGPTELLPTSHGIFEGRLPRVARPLGCTLALGELLVFDARMLHRGGANTGARHRRVLVVRFDSYKTPPPGLGVVGTQLTKMYAALWIGAASCLADKPR